MPASGSVYYGWWVAIACGLIAFAAWGTGFYQIGVFIRAYHERDGWSLTALSAGATISALVVGAVGVFCGRVIDRRGPRVVLATGGLLLAAGTFGLGQAQALWQIYLGNALMAAGFACTSMLPLGAVISRWFIRRRAFVMTLALSGAPLGALVLVPVSTALIERYGLGWTGAVLAVIALTIVLPATLLVIRDDPRSLGLEPDGDSSPAPKPLMTTPTWTTRAATRSSLWWLIALSYSAILLGQVAFLVHQVNFLSPLIGAQQAAVYVSITGACGLAGRFLGGLGDRFPKDRLAALHCGAQGLAVIAAAISTQPAVLALACAVVGLTMGNTLALFPLVTAERFGLRSYGVLFGAASLLAQWSTAAGVLLVGLLADRTGGYAVPYMLTGSLGLVAAALVLLSSRQAAPAMELSAATVPVRGGTPHGGAC